MIPLSFSYALPSSLSSTRERDVLGLAADVSRPVRFHGRIVREAMNLRFALQALAQVVWSDERWESRAFTLDPIVTVHPDRLFFEAFSSDQSSFGMVIADRSMFETEGEVVCGTTNVDFTAWLAAALGEIRSRRTTHLRIGAEGFEVATEGAGGRFEQKVEVPEPWVRGFLQLQGAMALPGTRLSVRPVDLLAAVRTLSTMKARVAPRGLRWEMQPGQDAALWLEPWDVKVPLVGALHAFNEPRVIRTWGRRRLKLLEPLLPLAERVDVYLKGRALPSFFAVKFGSITFVLGLSGWTDARWTESAGFDLLVAPGSSGPAEARARALLAEKHELDVETLAQSLVCSTAQASQLLAGLCARGSACFDVERRTFRHRELFSKPIDLARLYPPDPRREEAALLIGRGEVEVRHAGIREVTKRKRFQTPEGVLHRDVVFRDWVVDGQVAEFAPHLVLDDEDRLIFGTCTCPFFEEHRMGRGPCAHLLALLRVAQPQRRDLAAARVVEGPVEGGTGSEDDEGDGDLDGEESGDAED